MHIAERIHTPDCNNDYLREESGTVSVRMTQEIKQTNKKTPQDPIKQALKIILLLFSCWVMSNSLWSNGLQQARLSCPPVSPGVCSSSYPLSRSCSLIISSSATLFSFALKLDTCIYPQKIYESNPSKILNYLRIMAFQVIVINTLNSM